MPDAGGFTEPTHKRPGRAPTHIHVETAWAEPVTLWTVAQVRAALDAHDAGDFALSSVLADQFLRDPIIAGDVENRCRALGSRSALPFKVEAGGGDGRSREKARKRCEELWWETCRETTLFSVQKDAILIGASVGLVWWDRSSSEWRPRLRHLPSHGLAHNSEEGWTYTSRNGMRHEVTPGDGTWFLHLPYGERSWMFGAVRRLGEIWLQRLYAHRDMARFSERHGMPVLAIYEPDDGRDDVEGEQGAEGAQKEAYYRRLRARMTRDAVISLPQPRDKEQNGWDADWLELEGDGQSFITQLDKLEAESHYGILGRDPAGGAKGGDGELASERRHSEFLSSDAETLSTSIRDCIFKPDVAFNIDPDDVELAGWGRWDTRPPPNLFARARTLNTVADGIGKLIPMNVDCKPVLDEFGLEAKGELQAPPKPEAKPEATKDSTEGEKEDA